jgi:tyrosyl-tRNA synthetase
VDLICGVGMAGSRTEATRLISQGGVKINQEKKIEGKVTLAKKEKLLLQVGKRKFLYVIGK